MNSYTHRTRIKTQFKRLIKMKSKFRSKSISWPQWMWLISINFTSDQMKTSCKRNRFKSAEISIRLKWCDICWTRSKNMMNKSHMTNLGFCIKINWIWYSKTPFVSWQMTIISLRCWGLKKMLYINLNY